MGRSASGLAPGTTKWNVVSSPGVLSGSLGRDAGPLVRNGDLDDIVARLGHDHDVGFPISAAAMRAC
jgi:hypothetical protein